MSKHNESMRSLPVEQLVEKIENMRRELFSLKLNSLTTHIKDYSQFKKLRRDIARATTILREYVAAHIQN